MKELRNELSDTLADYINSFMEGDTHHVDEMTKLMKEVGYWDEDGESIYEDDETDHR